MDSRSFPRQEQVFVRSEGDAWFRRNEAGLKKPASWKSDPCLRLVSKLDPLPSRVLDVGCANGWRLAALAAAGARRLVGLDVSFEAVRDGMRRWSREGLRLVLGTASRMPFQAASAGGRIGEGFDLIVVGFVFHWIDRSSLLRTAAEIDRCLADGGHLVVADFFPDRPTVTPYHHLPDGEVFTYKQDYSRLFVATEMYRRIGAVVFDHDRPAEGVELDADDTDRVFDAGAVGEIVSLGHIDPTKRAAAVLLRKDPSGSYRRVP